jgi:membrane protein
VFLTLLPDKFNQIVGEVSQVLSIIIDIALFLLAYFILPRTETNWRGIMPGAIGAGLLWGIAKKAFLFFVSTYISISNLVYGSVAAIIALLTWAYISGLIFLFGAYINVTYYRLSHEYIESNHQNQHQGFDFESSDNLPKT